MANLKERGAHTGFLVYGDAYGSDGIEAARAYSAPTIIGAEAEHVIGSADGINVDRAFSTGPYRITDDGTAPEALGDGVPGAGFAITLTNTGTINSSVFNGSVSIAPCLSLRVRR